MEDLYAVFGNPIDQSLSPLIHSHFAAQTHQNIRYVKILSPLDGFESTVNEFITTGKGFNITAPFKRQAFAMATQVSPRAKITGAVNTIKVLNNGELYGDNTDGIGLLRDLKNHQFEIGNKSILVVGAGGAARGILPSILQEKPNTLVLINRTLQKGLDLSDEFKHLGIIEISELEKIKGRFDLILNCASLNPLAEFVMPTSILTKTTLCYDLMYGQNPTPFLKWAVANGISHSADGSGMLVEQAAEAFYLWRGIKPDTRSVIELLKGS